MERNIHIVCANDAGYPDRSDGRRFAIDSIPAIFAVTQEPFLVYTANVFPILGLRSMYFLLAGVVHPLVYLKYGLASVLVFVGVKMMLIDAYKMPIILSLMVIATLIAASITASLLLAPNVPPPSAARSGDPGDPPALPADPAVRLRGL